MKVRIGIGACALGLALALPAAAQTPDELMTRGAAAGVDVELMQELRARAGERGLDRAATARLLTPVVAAAEAGVPSRGVALKGLEGLSKGYPPPLIAGAMTNLQGSMVRAATLVDPWMTEPGVPEAVTAPAGGPDDAARGRLVESVGLALQAGASEAAVRELLDRVPAGLKAGRVSALRLGVAAEVLAEIPVAAESPGMAAELVLDALNSDFGAAELRELPAALGVAARRGQLPAEAVARGAMAQMRGGLPAATVLQNLFRGEFPGNAPFELPPGIEKARERGQGKGPPPS